MVAITMANMINNKVLMLISSKFDHSELIGNHYFGIYGKKKEKVSPLIFSDIFWYSKLNQTNVSGLRDQDHQYEDVLVYSQNCLNCHIFQPVNCP